MKLLHRGLTIELEDTDPRVAVIESILYGRPLPAPLPMPAVIDRAPLVPDNALRFWRALQPLQRKELLLLAERPYTPAEMEAALGVTQRVLMGRHSSIARLARLHRVAVRIHSRGRSRALKRFYLDDPTAEVVGILAQQGGD